MAHKVKTHRWNQGVLETIEYFFDTLEEARNFSGQVAAHVVKVVNAENEVVEARSVPYNQAPEASYSGADSTYA